MIETKRWLLGIVICISLAGCATQGASTFNYAEPSKQPAIENTTVIPEPFEAVWDRLVGRLATGFFVINNIDKASRLINVSFSADSPEQYVDCGESTRQFSFQNETRNYRYPVAKDSFFKTTGTWGPYNNLPLVAEVNRDTSLEGRINVYVAPVSPTETKVSVNTKYVLSVAVTGMAIGYNAFGQEMQRNAAPPSLVSVDFTTAESKTKNWGTGNAPENVTCRATGQLEKTLLALAK